ncbi:MAG: DNA-formamidopyrimidine glycosylase family protein [Candidatus Hodarchaeota archaeon]
MSVELPEAYILSTQMNEILPGKIIRSSLLQSYERLQKIGFINKDLEAFDNLIECKITSVTSRGMVIRIELEKEMNLLLCPEYGGQIRYHERQDTLPKKFHLKLDFTDDSLLTVRLTGMGLIFAACATCGPSRKPYNLSSYWLSSPIPIYLNHIQSSSCQSY